VQRDDLGVSKTSTSVSSGPSASGANSPPGLDHCALLYSSASDRDDAMRAFFADAERNDEPVVMLGAHERDLDAVGVPGGGTHPQAAVAGNDRPALVVAVYRKLLAGRLKEGAKRVRLVSEPYGLGPRSEPVLARYEAVFNHAFRSLPVTILCPYDTRSIDQRLEEEIERTHPTIYTSQGRTDSFRYRDPAELVAVGRHLAIEDDEPSLDAPIERGAEIPRRAVRDAVASADLPIDRVKELVTAFNEVATNAILHGSGSIRVRVWSGNHAAVCSVSDEGTTFDDRLAGYSLPSPAEIGERGMGLWLSRQLCDELDILPGPSGLTVRLVVVS
jgi:anti-sigma regulatory factor (Ser/Thr protein kinase)